MLFLCILHTQSLYVTVTGLNCEIWDFQNSANEDSSNLGHDAVVDGSDPEYKDKPPRRRLSAN